MKSVRQFLKMWVSMESWSMSASLSRRINVGVHSMTTERHSLMANSSTWTGKSAWPIGGTQQASFSPIQIGRPLTYNISRPQHRCDCLDIDHLLRYEWNFTGGAGHSLLWLEATTFLNYMDIYLNDHLLKYGRNVAGGGGNSLLWPEASVCLNYLGAYSRPEVDIVVYGPRLHCFI